MMWRHGSAPADRESIVQGVARAIAKLERHAREKKFRLAPFVGVACPGIISPDGSIRGGSHNLPGNWESKDFNLPRTVLAHLPRDAEIDAIVMHNDAVVQGPE